MKSETEKSLVGKITSWSIVGLVVAGTLLISGVADLSEGSGMMAKVFLLFLGAVIVVQVIPGLMLLGAMMKGIYSLFGKKAKANAGDSKK
jgi:ABC-type Na+ efflux pump permease subunit